MLVLGFFGNFADENEMGLVIPEFSDGFEKIGFVRSSTAGMSNRSGGLCFKFFATSASALSTRIVTGL